MMTLRRWNWPACAIVTWAIGCLLVAGLAFINPRVHTVYPIYATASHSWWAGEDMFVRQTETHELYRYSPAFAVLIGPFAALPLGVGSAVWKLANAGVFLLGLWQWCSRGLPVRLKPDQVAAVFLISGTMATGSLYNGQANLMMSGFILLALTAANEDRWWVAATCLGAATLIKVLPLALALVLSVLFWRTFPLRFLAVVVLGLALPFATQRPEYVADQTGRWFVHLTESVELNRERLRSLDKFLEVCGAGVEPRLFMLFAAAAGTGVLGASLWMRWRGVGERDIVFVAGAWYLSWVVLFSPSSESVTFAILSPVVAWMVVDSFARPASWLRQTWLIGSVVLLTPLHRLASPIVGMTIGAVMFQSVLILDLLLSRRFTGAPRTIKQGTSGVHDGNKLRTTFGSLPGRVSGG